MVKATLLLLLSLLPCLLSAGEPPVDPDIEITPTTLPGFKDLFPALYLVQQPRAGEFAYHVAIHAPKPEVTCEAQLVIVQGEARSMFHLSTQTTDGDRDTLVIGRITADLLDRALMLLWLHDQRSGKKTSTRYLIRLKDFVPQQ
jgi:hypothetical protein